MKSPATFLRKVSYLDEVLFLDQSPLFFAHTTEWDGGQFVGGQFASGQFVGGQFVGGQLSARR